MYLLFKYKNIMPSDIYFRGSGEKRILAAFIKREIEEKLKENKKSKGGKK